MRELNRKLGFGFPLDGPKTVNGLILEHLQEIPEPSTSMKIADHAIEIVQTQDRVVKAVRIFPRAPPAAQDVRAYAGGLYKAGCCVHHFRASFSNLLVNLSNQRTFHGDSSGCS